MDLYLITPPKSDFLDSLEPMLREGVNWLQYRRDDLDDSTRYDELLEVKSLSDRYGTKLLVNDRPDLALAVEADGVHLGDDDLPVRDVKDRWPDLIVGRTQRWNEPVNSDADYLSVGPVFPSSTKDVPAEESGWTGVQKILEHSDRPVFAIGGITPDTLDGTPESLAGVAVIGAVWNRADPVRAVREFNKLLD